MPLLSLPALLLSAGIMPGCAGPDETLGEETEETAAAESAVVAGSNLALGKPATQSSLYNGDGVPGHAVDGNTSGVWTGWSVTHTQAELSPWWQVDLGSVSPVGTVELYNRTDCCSDRLSNFKVLVSADGSSWQSWDHPGVAGTQVSFAVERQARYVRVQLNATGVANRILSLAEVKVLASNDLALGKPATQSSLYNGDGVPEHAVDGDTSGAWGNWSVTHTQAELSPWWQVDLGGVSPVGTVELYNRTDCCSDRLSNFKVLVSDDGSAWQSWDHPGVAGTQVSFAVNRTARYVKVQLNATGVANRILSLAEVRVLAPAGGAPACAAGQELLDGTTCVTLTPWPQRTDLPAGSKIAIRLRRAMVDYYGGSVVWTKWLGVSPTNSSLVDAVDTSLTSRNLFTVTTFRPPGEQYYDLPWYNMLASNGQYVRPSGGQLRADTDLPNAGTFARGSESWNPDELLFIPYPWSQVSAHLAEIKSYGNHYSICQSAFTLGMPNVIGWYSGPAPNYGCYVSGDVDYFVVN